MPSSSTQVKHHFPRKRRVIEETVSPPTCIFCEKEDKWVPYKKVTKRSLRFAHWTNKKSGWMKIASHANDLGDTRLFRLVKDEDLHAREAMYHPSCYHKFCSRYSNFKCKGNTKNSGESHKDNAAHIEAFTVVKSYIDDKVLVKNDIVSLSSLRKIYDNELEFQGSPKPNYKAEKLQAHLKQDEKFYENLVFFKVNPENKRCITY